MKVLVTDKKNPIDDVLELVIGEKSHLATKMTAVAQQEEAVQQYHARVASEGGQARMKRKQGALVRRAARRAARKKSRDERGIKISKPKKKGRTKK